MSNYPRGSSPHDFSVNPKIVQRSALWTQIFALILIALIPYTCFTQVSNDASAEGIRVTFGYIALGFAISQMIWIQYSIRFIWERKRIRTIISPEAISTWCLGLTLFAYVPVILAFEFLEKTSAPDFPIQGATKFSLRSGVIVLLFLFLAISLCSSVVLLVSTSLALFVVFGASTGIGLLLIILLIRTITARIVAWQS